MFWLLNEVMECTMNCKFNVVFFSALTAFIGVNAYGAGILSSENTLGLHPYAQYQVNYSNNIFDVQDANAAQSKYGTSRMSDTVQSATLGLLYNQSYGRQQVQLGVSATHNKYDYFSQYSNNDKKLNSSLAWVIGSKLTGHVSYDYSQTLTPFRYFQVTEKTMTSYATANADAVWSIANDWGLTAGVTSVRSDYNNAQLNQYDYTSLAASVGVLYKTVQDNEFGLYAKSSNGSYPNTTVVNGATLDNSYYQDEYNLKARWVPKSDLSFDLEGGWQTRRRKDTDVGKYSGLNARLSSYWKASGKSTLGVSAWQTFSGLTEADANFALSKGYALSWRYALTSKVSFLSQYRYENRNYNGVSIISGVSPLGRKDTYKKASVDMTYNAYQKLAFLMSLSKENNASNINGSSYSALGASISAKYTY